MLGFLINLLDPLFRLRCRQNRVSGSLTRRFGITTDQPSVGRCPPPSQDTEQRGPAKDNATPAISNSWDTEKSREHT